MSGRIIYDESAIEFILDALGYSINDEGYVLNKEKELIESRDGEFIHKNEISAIYKKNGQDAFSVKKSFILDFLEGEF